jgi:MFS family permease
MGDGGKYQMMMVLIFLICWFVTGIILLSTAFLFRNYAFDCKAHGLLLPDSLCSDYVCELPEERWMEFVDPDDSAFTSLATEENYLCSKSVIIDLVSSCTYFGAFVGYIVISFFSDNFGRKSSMAVSWGICTLGTIVVACSVNIYMVAVGLFLSGCGCDAAINICFFFFGEVVGDKKRQKYSVFVQIFFTLGAMTVTLFFSLIDSWRINWIVLVAGPAIIELALLVWYIEETPQFLVKKGVKATLKALNRIGKINTGLRSVLDEEDIQNVMDNQIA